MIRNIITGPMHYQRVKNEDGSTKIVATSEKLIARKKYAAGKSVYNPDNPNAMKIATVKGKQVIPRASQQKLPNKKLEEVRLIIVVDTVKEDVLYLRLTSSKSYLLVKSKFLEIDNVLKNGKHEKTLVDLDMDHLDYSQISLTEMKVNHISIKAHIILPPESIHKILKAANERLRNLELSKRKKKES